jgi:FKBP-type peptidyl-prolyl cis-trans isomerase (trigger factor)
MDNAPRPKIMKAKRDLLQLYHLMAEIMEEENPAVTDDEIAAELKHMIDNIEHVIEELSKVMKHHDRLNKG